jgi:hypothetical protein
MAKGREPLTIDNSIVAATAKCDTFAFVRYALGLATRGESLPLIAGQSVHAGLAVWLEGGTPDAAAKVVEADYRRKLSSYLVSAERDRLPPEDKRFEDEWVVAVAHQYMTRYDERRPFKFVQATAERPILHDFGMTARFSKRPVTYSARLDGVVRKWETGGQWSLDWKTTKRLTEYWTSKQKVSSQFSGQIWLGRESLHTELQGVIVVGIELPDPHKSENKCKEHKVSYQECSIRHAGDTILFITRAPREMASWRYTTEKLINRYDRLLQIAEEEGIEGIEAVQMQGRFNDSCSWCSMNRWCLLGRNTSKAAIRATFVSDPWDPTALPD